VFVGNHKEAANTFGEHTSFARAGSGNNQERPVAKFDHATLRWRKTLVASLFLQLFGLITPLFFQVVIDKVLVHRGLITLDVLVIGLVTVSLFESVLGALRTYVFSHTTNRIDVELGARLFRHLTHLPIGYFQARRAGDSVARVRELENIHGPVRAHDRRDQAAPQAPGHT
jgi:ABC-type bacteriocin/lantibiotic exporter with double-glycine peptidase domain